MEVHDIKDLAFRQRIIDTLGEDIYFTASFPEEEKNVANTSLNEIGLPAKDGNSSIVREKIKNNYENKGAHNVMQGPPTEKEMLERNSAQALLPWNPSSKLDDWYN